MRASLRLQSAILLHSTPRPLRIPRAHTRRPRPIKLQAKREKESLALCTVLEEDAFEGLTEILDGVKWSKNENLVPVIVQAGGSHFSLLVG